ncbi:MAG: AsmA family protein, partial [Myxococcaceae bacterium]
MKRALKVALWIAGGLVGLVLLLVLAVTLLVDVDALVNEQVAKKKPVIEEQLGRKVEIGQIRTSVFPTLGGSVEALTVAADPQRPEQERPLVAVGEIRFAFGLWDALLSGGKRLTVKEASIRGLKVDIVRQKDGTLSYEDILARQSAEEAPEPGPETSEPLSAEDQELLSRISIDALMIEDATFRFVDLATPTGAPAVSEIKHFNFRIEDAALEKPIRIDIDAAVFSEATNFRFSTTVGPIPSDLKMPDLPPVQSVTMKADAVDLSRLSPYLPDSELARIDSAVFSADWKVGAVSDQAPLPIQGFLEVKALQLQGGEKFDLRLDADLAADLANVGVQISRLALKMGTVELTAAGALETLATKPRFRDFTLRSNTLSPGALLAYYPAARKDLPPGLRLEGNAVLDVTASGDADKQRIDAKLDLAQLDILYPGMLVKPRGVPMGVAVKGDFTANDANLERLALRLDELDVAILGTVKNFAEPTLDLRASAKPFSFDGLVRLVPEIRTQLEAQGAKASGQGKLAGHVKGTARSIDAALDFSLSGMKLDIPGTTVDGDLVLTAKAKGDPDGKLGASLRFDANEAVIRINELMDKGVKTPLMLAVELQRSPERLDIKTFDLKLAELGLAVKGGMDVPNNQMDVTVDLQKLDLEKFSRTITALPKDLVRNSHLAFRMAMSGNPEQMETLKLVISDLDLRIGRSDLRGHASLQNLVRPDLKLTASSSLLDLDELMGEDEEEKADDGATKEGGTEVENEAPDDPELRKYRFEGMLTAARVIYEGAELRDFRGKMRLEDGRLVLDEATFRAYEGTVSASGTEAEIWRGKMPFKARMQIKDVNLGRALAEQTRYKDALDGRADLKIDLSGAGYSTADLEKFLHGSIDLGLRKGQFNRASITGAVGGQLSALQRIPGVSTKALVGRNEIKDLIAKLVVKDGKLQLVEPVTFGLDQSRVTLGGAIGIAGKLFLEGTYFLPGSVLSSVTGGRCGADQKELAIPIEIAGSVDGPEYRPNAGGIATSLVESCLKSGAVGAAVDSAKSKIKQATGIDVPTDVTAAKK